jgi:hypothetical protein
LTLAESRWVSKPEDDNPIIREETLGEIKEMARKMVANLRWRFEQEGATVAQLLERNKMGKVGMPRATTSFIIW